jgi:hypothetical protein
MKYWGYLFAKLTVAAVFLWAVQYAIGRSFPHRVTILRSQQELFAHDLTYTSIMMLYFLLSIGVFVPGGLGPAVSVPDLPAALAHAGVCRILAELVSEGRATAGVHLHLRPRHAEGPGTGTDRIPESELGTA